MTKIKKVCLKCILKIKFTIFAEKLESIFIYFDFFTFAPCSCICMW